MTRAALRYRQKSPARHRSRSPLRRPDYGRSRSRSRQPHAGGRDNAGGARPHGPPPAGSNPCPDQHPTPEQAHDPTKPPGAAPKPGPAAADPGSRAAPGAGLAGTAGAQPRSMFEDRAGLEASRDAASGLRPQDPSLNNPSAAISHKQFGAAAPGELYQRRQLQQPARQAIRPPISMSFGGMRPKSAPGAHKPSVDDWPGSSPHRPGAAHEASPLPGARHAGAGAACASGFRACEPALVYTWSQGHCDDVRAHVVTGPAECLACWPSCTACHSLLLSIIHVTP